MPPIHALFPLRRQAQNSFPAHRKTASGTEVWGTAASPSPRPGKTPESKLRKGIPVQSTIQTHTQFALSNMDES